MEDLIRSLSLRQSLWLPSELVNQVKSFTYATKGCAMHPLAQLLIDDDWEMQSEIRCNWFENLYWCEFCSKQTSASGEMGHSRSCPEFEPAPHTCLTCGYMHPAKPNSKIWRDMHYDTPSDYENIIASAEKKKKKVRMSEACENCRGLVQYDGDMEEANDAWERLVEERIDALAAMSDYSDDSDDSEVRSA